MIHLKAWLAGVAMCFFIRESYAFKLETGPYFIRLREDRQCQNDDFLGFYNRSCGSQPPRSVGPSLRASSAITWRQWVLTILGETDKEQWGYMETHYPEERGESRCVGPLNAANIKACQGTASEGATIDPALGKTVFSFVPLEEEAGTYRIIVRDRSEDCNRFLTAPKDCSINTVFFSNNESGRLQQWVFTKVDPDGLLAPTPQLPEPSQSPAPVLTSTPSPVPYPALFTPPPLSISKISFTSAAMIMSFPDGEPSISCTITLSPGKHSKDIFMAQTPGNVTISFSELLPGMKYTAAAFCEQESGTQSVGSVSINFTTLGSPYNLPEEATLCDGRGEIQDLERCVCDARRGFVPRKGGGCICNNDLQFVDDGIGGCTCDPELKLAYDGSGGCVCDSSAGFVEDGQGQCVCDSSSGYKPDTMGGCVCNAENNFVENELGGCSCDAEKYFVGDGEGGCTCDIENQFVDNGEGVCVCLFCLAENGVTILCPGASVGDSGEVNGVVYTKRNVEDITISNAASTCTSGITNMAELFRDKSSFNADISHWDTSSVTNMAKMFRQASTFNVDISKWDTSSVIDMLEMFYKASSFNADISEWDTSSLENMGDMFREASDFNADISKWDISQVTNMQRTFRTASSFNQDIGDWNISKVTDMRSMFREASSFNKDIGRWDTSKVESMLGLFYEASVFNQDIGNWNTGQVTNMGEMFKRATDFDQDLSSWCVEKISQKPNGFDEGAAFVGQANKQPNWNTPCPT